ncbi:hypothetical protein [Roseburia sp. 1XD42-69]|nr:hypothetical protein [Roseburia sp. 1XD42-69]
MKREIKLPDNSVILSKQEMKTVDGGDRGNNPKDSISDFWRKILKKRK